jgi:hypothetical protein
MDMSILAKKMLEYERVQRQADALKHRIEEAVMDLGKSQTVGNVKATFRNGRKSYDYEAIGSTAKREQIMARTKMVAKTDWRKLVLEDLGIEQDDVPFTQGDPSVSVKLTGG